MRYTGLLWFIGAVTAWSYSGCGGDVDPLLNEQQKAARILMEGSPWGIEDLNGVLSVPTGIDPSELTGLVLTFDASGEPDWIPAAFGATGAEDYLSSENATWGWGTTTGTDVITLTNASASELTGVVVQEGQIRITFEIGGTGGRTTGLDGTYTLQMTPN